MIAPEPSIEPAFAIESKSYGEVEVVLREDRRARAAGEPQLDLAARRRAAGEVVDDLARGHAEHDLVVAGPLDVARDGDELRAGRVLDADLRVLLAAHLHDVRDGHQRLDVVDERRALEEALVGGERRLQARVAALALERVEQRGLLAADVGARAAVHDEAEVEARAEDVLPEVAGLVGLGQRGVEDVGLLLVLAADVDERAGRAGREGGDDDALDERVRRLRDELAVLERAGLGLVRVAHEVLVHRPGRHERDLRPMAKPAPPRPRTLDASSSSVICCGCIAIALRSDS